MRSTLRETALLIFAAIFFAVLYRQFFAPQFAWIRTASVFSFAADTSFGENFSLNDIRVGDSAAVPQFVTLERAAHLHRTQNAVFLDAREEERFAAGHITGAVHVSYHAPENWAQALANLDHAQIVLVYCDDDCDSAQRLAEALIAQGFRKVYVMDKGFASWKNAGLPVTQ